MFSHPGLVLQALQGVVEAECEVWVELSETSHEAEEQKVDIDDIVNRPSDDNKARRVTHHG